MALIGFGYKCKLSVIAAKVTGTHNDFLLLLTEDNLPPEIFDADGSFPALNGGGDIRFSVDSDGLNQIPCEIVSFMTDNDPALGIAEIWLKLPALSSISVFYIWWDKVGETQPLATALYGSEDVWSEYSFSTHLNSINPKDSSGNIASLINSGATLTTGKIGNALNFTNSSIRVGDVWVDGDFTVSAWVNTNSATGYQGILGDWDGGSSDRAYMGLTSGRLNFDGFSSGANVAPTTLMPSVDYLLTISRENGVFSLYIDGTLDHSFNDSGNSSHLRDCYIGAIVNGTNYFFSGSISEVSVFKSHKSSDRILTESNNQNNPAGFMIAEVPETALPSRALIAAGSVIGQLIEFVTLDQFQTINIETATHISQSENTNLYQAQTLNIKTALHIILQGNVEYSYGQSINIYSNFHGHQGEEILFNVEEALFVDGAFLLHETDVPSFIAFQALQLEDAYHPHMSRGHLFSDGGNLTPNRRQIPVYAEFNKNNISNDQRIIFPQ